MAIGVDSGRPHPRVGLFFVHGIGEQQRGDTLVAWADALIDFLRGSLGADAVRVSGARLQKDVDQATSSPAHLTVSISLPGEQGDADWRLAEGWWAQAFGPPNFRELAAWAFLSLPYTILAHVVTTFRRAWMARGGWLVRSVLIASSAVGVLLAVLVAPLLTLVVGVILLVGVLPINRLRRIAGALQRSLSQSVGDSYVLLSSPARAAAIVEAVCRDLEWLAGRVDGVIVVAHSQGAEVAHRAVRRQADTKVRRLITVGSGQSKLFMAARAGELGHFRGVWFAPAGVLVVALAMLVGFRTWSEQGSDTLWSMLVVVFIGVGLFAVGIQRAGALGTPSDVQLESGAVDGWLDLYASHDPVPNGPLFLLEEREGIFTSRRVSNRGSVLRDHAAYVRNLEQVVTVVAEAACAVSGGELSTNPREDEGVRAVAALRRSWRVAWLRAARWVAVAGGLAIAVRTWAYDDSAGPDVLRPVVTVFERVLSIDVPAAWTTDEELTAAAALALGSATAVVGYLAFLAPWVWWEANDRRDLYRGSEASLLADYQFPLWTPGFVALMEALVGYAIVVAWVNAGALDLAVRHLSALEWAQVFLIPVLVWVVAFFAQSVLSWLPRLLERMGWLIEPGHADPTNPLVFAILGPYTVALVGSAVFTVPDISSGFLVFVLLAGPFLLLYLGVPFLSSSHLVRRALLPLRALAYAPPCEPPSSRYLNSVRLNSLVATHLQPALDRASSEPVTDDAIERVRTCANVLKRYPRADLGPDATEALEQTWRLVDQALTSADAGVDQQQLSTQFRAVTEKVRVLGADLQRTLDRGWRPPGAT